MKLDDLFSAPYRLMHDSIRTWRAQLESWQSSTLPLDEICQRIAILLPTILPILGGLTFTFLYPHLIGLPQHWDRGLNDMVSHLEVTLVMGFPVFVVAFIAAFLWVTMNDFPEEIAGIPMGFMVSFGVVFGILSFHWATSSSAGGKAPLAGLMAIHGPNLIYLSIVGIGAGFRASHK